MDWAHVLVIVQCQTDGCSLSCKDGAIVWQSFGKLAAGCLTILETAVENRRCPHSLIHFGAISVDFIMWSLRFMILTELSLAFLSGDGQPSDFHMEPLGTALSDQLGYQVSDRRQYMDAPLSWDASRPHPAQPGQRVTPALQANVAWQARVMADAMGLDLVISSQSPKCRCPSTRARLSGGLSCCSSNGSHNGLAGDPMRSWINWCPVCARRL